MRKESGFTLMELVTALAVAATCTMVGVPALRAFAQQQRAVAAMNRLSAHLANARVTAITHGRPVVACPADPSAMGCVQGADWSRGWIAFLDPDGDRRPDRSGEIVAVEQAPAGGVLRVLTSAGRPQVRYLPDGRAAGSNATFELCDVDGRLLGKVIVSNMGRTRTERPAEPLSCT